MSTPRYKRLKKTHRSKFIEEKHNLFGAILTHHRVHVLEMTQDDLCEALSDEDLTLKRQLISQIETSRTNTDWSIYNRILKFLDLPTEWNPKTDPKNREFLREMSDYIDKHGIDRRNRLSRGDTPSFPPIPKADDVDMSPVPVFEDSFNGLSLSIETPEEADFLYGILNSWLVHNSPEYNGDREEYMLSRERFDFILSLAKELEEEVDWGKVEK